MDLTPPRSPSAMLGRPRSCPRSTRCRPFAPVRASRYSPASSQLRYPDRTLLLLRCLSHYLLRARSQCNPKLLAGSVATIADSRSLLGGIVVSMPDDSLVRRIAAPSQARRDYNPVAPIMRKQRTGRLREANYDRIRRRVSAEGRPTPPLLPSAGSEVVSECASGTGLLGGGKSPEKLCRPARRDPLLVRRQAG